MDNSVFGTRSHVFAPPRPLGEAAKWLRAAGKVLERSNQRVVVVVVGGWGGLLIRVRSGSQMFDSAAGDQRDSGRLGHVLDPIGS